MAAEIDVAVDRVCTKARKAPESDRISNNLLTMVLYADPGILDIVFNPALKSRVFPTRWKVTWVVLLPKCGWPVGHWIMFHSLSILDSVGKIFEQVIAEWLRKHFLGKHALSATSIGSELVTLKVRPHYAARQNATHCNFALRQKLLGICHQCDRVHMKKEFFADLLHVTETVERDQRT